MVFIIKFKCLSDITKPKIKKKQIGWLLRSYTQKHSTDSVLFKGMAKTGKQGLSTTKQEVVGNKYM